ncbi:P-loop containing nucleoside triphosphate hydrolase protein [Kalaharituber pfeilii]|nr:P-loop containing nucleoside triphosphate hydrolase protein [Kalaharituber pfeilii]
MEAAGLAIGIARLALQLAGISQEWSNIFSDMKEIGYAQDSVSHDLRVEGLRLKDWERVWGLRNTSSQQHQHPDPNDERYRIAVASLTRIVTVFEKIAELQARYQGEPEKTSKSGKRYSLRFKRLFPRTQSRSPSPGCQVRPATSPSLQSSIISTLNSGDLSLPKILANTELAPKLEEDISALHRVAQNIQQSMPTLRKLRWAITDKTKCDELVGQLKKYIDHLYNILPLNAPIPCQSKSVSLSFDIPFNLPDIRRNSYFVGREGLLEQLKREIEVKEDAAVMDITQVVLHGMGGIGKTQLALEYVYRHSGNYSSMFWINAASEQTTRITFTHIMQQLIKHHASLSDEPDYAHIGRLLGMAGKLDSTGMFIVQQSSEEQHVVNAVKEWLTAKDNTKWLLVFDNLDDLESFDINDYIPTSAHGTVIITSRRRESIQERRWLEVQQMNNSEAEDLLFKSAKLDFEILPPDEHQREKEAAATIVQKLGYLPLAIAQAGACIHIRDYLFSRYLEAYETNCTHLLSKKWKVGKHDRSVLAAWDLSFNAIQNQNRNAAELLLLCGLLDNNDICEEMLWRGMNLPKDDTSLEDSIQILLSYSMAKRKDRGDSFNIHPLVHIWAQWKLEMEPERRSKKVTEALHTVASAIFIPASRRRKVEDWVFERRILPHIFAVERHIKFLKMENKQILTAVNCLSTVYYRQGYFRKAEELCKVVLVGFEESLGVDHPDTLGMVYNMGMMFSRQGQHSKALELFERALTGREKSQGADHPSTLSTVHIIGIVLFQEGEYNKALEFYERALAGREEALGADHSDTLGTVHGMGMVFSQQGKHNKALEFFERALAGYGKVLGANHPHTLGTVHNMGMVFRQQGQYNRALEFYKRALAGREKALGADHPDTLATIHGMGTIYHQQGQYNKALELYERVLVGYEKALGVDHLATLSIVNSMGVVFHQQGQHNRALEFYERALVGREKALPADHPDILLIVRNMANSFEAIGQSDKARELQERASRGSSANAPM